MKKYVVQARSTRIERASLFEMIVEDSFSVQDFASSLSGDTVVYEDSQGLMRSFPTSEFTFTWTPEED